MNTRSPIADPASLPSVHAGRLVGLARQEHRKGDDDDAEDRTDHEGPLQAVDERRVGRRTGLDHAFRAILENHDEDGRSNRAGDLLQRAQDRAAVRVQLLWQGTQSQPRAACVYWPRRPGSPWRHAAGRSGSW